MIAVHCIVSQWHSDPQSNGLRLAVAGERFGHIGTELRLFLDFNFHGLFLSGPMNTSVARAPTNVPKVGGHIPFFGLGDGLLGSAASLLGGRLAVRGGVCARSTGAGTRSGIGRTFEGCGLSEFVIKARCKVFVELPDDLAKPGTR